MKAQGTSGSSRGSLKEGIATGLSMLSFIPLHLSTVEQSPGVVDRVCSWFPGKEIELLEPKYCFERGHDIKGGSYDPRGFWRPAIKSGIFICPPSWGSISSYRRTVEGPVQATGLYPCIHGSQSTRTRVEKPSSQGLRLCDH